MTHRHDGGARTIVFTATVESEAQERHTSGTHTVAFRYTNR